MVNPVKKYTTACAGMVCKQCRHGVWSAAMLQGGASTACRRLHCLKRQPLVSDGAASARHGSLQESTAFRTEACVQHSVADTMQAEPAPHPSWTTLFDIALNLGTIYGIATRAPSTHYHCRLLLSSALQPSQHHHGRQHPSLPLPMRLLLLLLHSQRRCLVL